MWLINFKAWGADEMSMCTDVKLNAQDCSHRLLEATTGGRFFFFFIIFLSPNVFWRQTQRQCRLEKWECDWLFPSPRPRRDKSHQLLPISQRSDGKALKEVPYLKPLLRSDRGCTEPQLPGGNVQMCQWGINPEPNKNRSRVSVIRHISLADLKDRVYISH